MQTPRISTTTADTAGNFFKSLASTGILPKSEATAAAAILREAANKQRIMPVMLPKSNLLTVKQAAERFACSSRNVARMLDDGTLTRRYLRPGNAKSLRISSTEIDAIIGGGEANGAA
jgi:excisionase family DNA binding protein